MSLAGIDSLIGRSETQHDHASERQFDMLAALLDHDRGFWREGIVPPLGHWLLFPPLAAQKTLGDDGHPALGSGLIPDLGLPRRMWAGSRVKMLRPIILNSAVTRETVISNAVEKNGRTGKMLFITLTHNIKADGETVIIRVNADWLNLIEDLQASVLAGVTAIMLPKVDAAWRVASISEIITELESRAGLEVLQIGVIALIEDALGLTALDDIARQDRFLGFALGSEDFALSMGVAPTPQLLDYPCRQIALAAARHGATAWAMSLSISIFDDADAINATLTSASQYGIVGALCIHPKQVAAANRIFAADPEQIAEARSIVAAWDSDGSSGATSHNGRMIDRPVVERARRLLARQEMT